MPKIMADRRPGPATCPIPFDGKRMIFGGLGKGAAMLHIGLQSPMIRIGGVEPVGKAVFVGRENSADLEQAGRLVIDADPELS